MDLTENPWLEDAEEREHRHWLNHSTSNTALDVTAGSHLIYDPTHDRNFELDEEEDETHAATGSSPPVTHKTYGDVILGEEARAHLGDVSQDVNIQGDFNGDLHLHFNAQPQDLSIVAVVHTFIKAAADFRKVGYALQKYSEYERWEDIRLLIGFVGRLDVCISQMDSAVRSASSLLDPALRDLCISALKEARALRSLLEPLAVRLKRRPIVSASDSVDVDLADTAQGRAWLAGEQKEEWLRDTLAFFRSIWNAVHANGEKELQVRLEAVSRYAHKLNTALRGRVQGLSSSDDLPAEFSLDFSDSIKSALYFREESDRLVEVKKAHQKTFHWIFQRNSGQATIPTNDADDSNLSFRSWLERRSGCFWVNGKAGSGKSTLMKYIYQHSTMTQLLNGWAGRRQLITCPFFFWYAGKPLQKSQEGVLRSMLYRVLEARPSLTPLVFPRLSQYIVCKGCPRDLNITITELYEAMQLLAKNVPDDLAIFLLVDGVDEYTGDHFDFSNFLVGLVEDSPMKLLVSSRPIPECFQIFSRFPTLRLQDLTAGDIRAYVEHELIRDRLFQEMNCLEPGFSREVRDVLVEKSSGVFLWIVLVVRRLLIGLGKYESRERLMQIIDELPNDLLLLYDHMFCKMSPEHQREGSLLFQLTVRARDVQHCSLTALQLMAACKPASSRDDHAQTSAKSDEALRVKAMDGKLRSRCCCLIEVQYSDIRGPLKDPKVDFLHRTVYDYLHDTGVWVKLAEVNQMSFNEIDLKLLNGCVYEVKRRSTFRTRHGKALELPIDLFTAALEYSDRLSLESDHRYVNCLEMADESFSQCCQASMAPLMIYQQACKTYANRRGYIMPEEQTSFAPEPGPMYQLGSVLAMAKVGLPPFFRRKLEIQKADDSMRSLILLYNLALVKTLDQSSPLMSRYMENISILLEMNADVNFPALNVSPTDVPLLLRCSQIKEYFGQQSLTPWEFWLHEAEANTLHIIITLKFLKKGIKRRGDTNPISWKQSIAQLSQHVKMYQKENHCDASTTHRLQQVIELLQSLAPVRDQSPAMPTPVTSSGVSVNKATLKIPSASAAQRAPSTNNPERSIELYKNPQKPEQPSAPKKDNFEQGFTHETNTPAPKPNDPLSATFQLYAHHITAQLVSQPNPPQTTKITVQPKDYHKNSEPKKTSRFLGSTFRTSANVNNVLDNPSTTTVTVQGDSRVTSQNPPSSKPVSYQPQQTLLPIVPPRHQRSSTSLNIRSRFGRLFGSSSSRESLAPDPQISWPLGRPALAVNIPGASLRYA